MGSKRFRSIRDFVRHDCAIELRCSCGHQNELDARKIYLLFLKNAWPAGIEVAGRRFRCRRCRRRWPEIGPVDRG